MYAERTYLPATSGGKGHCAQFKTECSTNEANFQVKLLIELQFRGLNLGVGDF